RILKKSMYKVGLCAIALAIMKINAGGVTDCAQGNNFTTSDSSAMRNTQVVVMVITSYRSYHDGPV
ncbi:hypothetical protein ACJBT6_10555, partial [Streptococcus suis]